jgi:alpha-glucosidase
VKIAGVWMQDWVGQHKFPEGTRLLWNWSLNRKQYPEWDAMVAAWKLDDVKAVVYLNPYLADLKEFNIESELFREGLERDFFVKTTANEVYFINSLSIRFAIIDLTNKDACLWTKEIIKNKLVKEAGAAGWMHDFGEYLPFDAVLSDGSDPLEYHSRYVEVWANIAKEAIQELGMDDELFYFMRAGTATSPAKTSLLWMGDQLPTFDGLDGM